VTEALLESSRAALPRETATAESGRGAFHAQQINAVCATNPSAHILAVACGRMPEASLSTAIRYRFFGRLVGVDRDVQALTQVSKTVGHLGVETLRGSPETVLSWARELDPFDYIYSYRLYEAFDERFCRRLTRRLFELLRPGGRLLLGSLTAFRASGNSAESVGCFAAFVRTPSTMQRLAADIPPPWRARTSVYVGPCGRTVYLDLRRT
jgi:hypothetical protein